ncbi:bifunctional peptidase and (3S)-lysyl hydroxylase Jmjd7-like [Stegodyphus dumicola]|uniref:bifunctional peptidase and (3S)-lysyl hydroxylase Jmjd7-like n=1 Tax=Stegodyphus dumicola TaxID=202533 RepID=UPI0015ABC984|nr:bifunctional peptidase and (3S)-lysyl hydroxylase Jmjd7-like [Stegodyphus dumicola]
MPETFDVADDAKVDNLKLLKCVADLSEEYNALHSGEIATIESIPSSTEFLRRWVSHNIPVIIKNAVSHWPALRKWNASYLKSKLGGKPVTVSVTPNGYADAVFSDRFMLPEEKIMTFEEFLDIMENPKSSEVCYIQKQNNSFLEEFSNLIDDADTHIPWATKALGINFKIIKKHV